MRIEVYICYKEKQRLVIRKNIEISLSVGDDILVNDCLYGGKIKKIEHNVWSEITTVYVDIIPRIKIEGADNSIDLSEYPRDVDHYDPLEYDMLTDTERDEYHDRQE